MRKTSALQSTHGGHHAARHSGSRPQSVDPLRSAREKITRVFRYLEALNQHRNPVQRQLGSQEWRLWLHDLPQHITTQRGTPAVDSTVEAGRNHSARRVDHDSAENFVIKVRRPKLTAPPDPPQEIAGWLRDGWDDPSRDAEFRRSIEPREGHLRTDGENFGDSAERLSAYRHWQLERDAWAATERPARAAMKIFEMLYHLHGRLEREAEQLELMLGDGILSWRRPEGDIYHPILLQRLQLEFNAAIPEFTLTETDDPVELYSALFQSMTSIDGRALGRCREELERGDHHPLSGDATSSFLKRLVVQLSPRGEFVATAPGTEQSEPCIGRDPVIFLRQRTLGFAAAIEGVLDDLRTRRELPWSLLNIVGEAAPFVGPDNVIENGGPSTFALCQAEAEVLLSKPANLEQIRIAQQLERHGGVLVQGPPGTGKTHTIANLIGHLLAQGKSVLVTSHTTKALRMVRHHIVPGLRPLCVSVLESDLESRRQLESAVASIAERLGCADAALLEREAQNLEVERRDLLQKLEDMLRQIAEARADEYRLITIGDRAWTPAEAARKINQEESSHNWIPGPILAAAPQTIAHEQLSELYRTNVAVSREHEHELSGDLPDPDELFTPEEFEAAVRERNRLRLEDLDFCADFWHPGPVQGTEKQIEDLATRLVLAVEPLSGKEKWKLAAVYAGKYGGTHRQPWEQLVAFVQFVHREAADSQEALLEYGPMLAEGAELEQQQQIADEIVEHLEMGGHLGSLVFWKHKAWGRFVVSARVNGGRPTLAAHFEALRKLARLKVLRRDLSLRWDRQIAPLGAPSSSQMGETIENTLVQFCDPIQDCLEWRERTWTPLLEELRGLGFRWERFIAAQPVCIGAYGELARIERAVIVALLPVLSARLHKLRFQRISHDLHDLSMRLEFARLNFKSSRVIAELADATVRMDSSSYGKGYARLLDVKSREADLDLRRNLLCQLESAAPAWAAQIRNRDGVHGAGEMPGDPEQAWVWRQLNDELERRADTSLEGLQSRGEKLREKLRRVTVDLIDRRAWGFQAQRTSSHQRQSLIGWLDTIRRIGKGTGIRAPRLRAEAARKMSECRGAVPVWVMPLSRVVENFDPRVTRFDVVIIDEASQSDVMALLALYLGKSVLVVGDHEQVSPTPVGQDLGLVENLISQYLHGIPNSHLYDGQISIYDLARQSFGGTTCLVEHFRCAPEIIQFSNMVSYDSRVKPLRDTSRVQILPPLVSYRVTGASRDEKVNRQEALAVTSLIAAATEQPEYQTNEAHKPVSFGVVSLIGDEQAITIDGLLRAHLSPDRYEMHRLLCGNAAQFQGDERDVMFISLVDTTERGALRLRDQQLFKQRFNVAASRARDQMWIVHSLDPEQDLKPGDLRRQLIEHAYDPGHLMRALEEAEEKSIQSPLEREVMKRLECHGYRVTPQWRVGKYRIDLVVEGDGKRLAIECDGDPSQWIDLNKMPEDMERQAILERLGWIFTRVRASEFLRDPEHAMHTVLDKLHLLEITPDVARLEGLHQNNNSKQQQAIEMNGSLNTVACSLPAEGLVDRVIRRAGELRQEWVEATKP
jgi:very-short-patch-repair endonuclease